MKRIFCVPFLALLIFSSSSIYGQEVSLEDYLSKFDYKERINMKIDSKTLVKSIKEGKVQFIDIRFMEEYKAWHMGFGMNIPLNELPSRLSELKKDKVIVTACPHKDRAIIGMIYLKTKGFHSKYLADGLVGLAEYLRGDKAREFIQ